MSEQLETAPANSGADFAQLDESDPRRLEAQRRLVYVRCVLAALPRRWNAAGLKPLIVGGGSASERRATAFVQRWVRAYEAAGAGCIGVAAELPGARAAFINQPLTVLGERNAIDRTFFVTRQLPRRAADPQV